MFCCLDLRRNLQRLLGGGQEPDLDLGAGALALPLLSVQFCVNLTVLLRSGVSRTEGNESCQVAFQVQSNMNRARLGVLG